MLFNMISIVLFFIVTNSALASYERSDWLWICQKASGICEKVKAIPVDNYFIVNRKPQTTLKLCRLTCGTYGALWPQPTIKTVLSDDIVKFHPSAVTFHILNKTKKVANFLNDVTQIFYETILNECGTNCSVKTQYNVAVQLITMSDNIDLVHHTNESYFLHVGTNGHTVNVRITSRTVFGIRHGLETLSQLIASYETHSYEETRRGLVIVTDAEIHDKPVFPHRGLLLDTARNFLPLKTIKRQIDAMAASKLNVLHWHATDTQSFPLMLASVPQLARYGAYSNKQVYMPSDVKHLLKYAKFRGVRIILEIDMPSHSGNGWQFGIDEGLGELALCVNKKPWRQYCIQPPCGQLNPINRNTYDVLGKLFHDVINIFPKDEYFHMGGDELFIPCWNSSQSIIQYLNDFGKTTDKDGFLWLWGEFKTRSLESFDNEAGNSNTNIIVWSSGLTDPKIITKYLDKKRFIIQTWVPTEDELPLDLVGKGYRIIISTKDVWYLDHGFWGKTTYHDWRSIYKNEMLRHPNVLGGEVCMWGEYVDQFSIDAKVWPRAAAAAERLWSDPEDETNSVEPRFYSHRARLINRGVNPEAVAPRWCIENEGECV